MRSGRHDRDSGLPTGALARCWLELRAIPWAFGPWRPSRRCPSSFRSSRSCFHDFAGLREAREDIDGIIVEFTREATEEHFEAPLPYRNTRGVPFTRRFGFLVQHFFNHQTHHRGQVTTLLTQLGLDPGDTDLIVLVPEFEDG